MLLVLSGGLPLPIIFRFYLFGYPKGNVVIRTFSPVTFHRRKQTPRDVEENCTFRTGQKRKTFSTVNGIAKHERGSFLYIRTCARWA